MSDLRKAAERTLRWLDSETPTTVDAAYAEERAIADALRAALAQQPEPVQEPVVWMVYTLDGKSVCVTDNPADFTDEHRVLPLYTSPPQRPPLTDEEIDKAVAQERDALLDHIYEYGTLAEGVLERIRRLARAIERKVRGEE